LGRTDLFDGVRFVTGLQHANRLREFYSGISIG